LSLGKASKQAVKEAVAGLPLAEAAHGTYEPREPGPSRETCTCTVVKAPDGREAYYELLIGGPGETGSGECEGDSAESIVEEMLTSLEEQDPDIEWELDVVVLRPNASPRRKPSKAPTPRKKTSGGKAVPSGRSSKGSGKAKRAGGNR
jgi:hypothetical protein